MKNPDIIPKHKLLLILFCLILFISYSSTSFALQLDNINQAQNYNEYKGKVVDSETNNPLVFAEITIVDTNIGTITNKEGEFSLKVPATHLDKNISISYLGFESQILPISGLSDRTNKISLKPLTTTLETVNIKAVKDAEALVKLALNSNSGNYLQEKTNMTAFYRETIKKGKRNASLAEAVVNIVKEPYNKAKSDAVELLKSRKNTNYSKLDTIALKLQGGPYSALYSDMVKYPRYVFSRDFFEYYNFSFEPFTQINNREVYVVKFEQKENVVTPLYFGKLFIDVETYALVSAVYQLNLDNTNEVIKLFIKKKPPKVKVEPTEASYRVDYRENNGRYYYSYSNLQLGFRVKWRKKLFGSNYTLNVEMAITDWKKNTGEEISRKDKLKSNVILSDEASGFSDPEFWGQYNIIEPEKSIESAIKKISKQLKRLKK
ncbi:MAG: carboxypeptidase-like regulatory domain-containing protein [Flavobacteriaceae bacterium]|nr:carboxypeptidase-like regulatory domain-containing protein [Flavobacteriaceae bacterium]